MNTDPFEKPMVVECTSGSSLTAEDLQTIARDLEHTPYIAYFPDKAWRSMRELYVARVDEKLVGLLALVNLGANWVEIGPFLIIRNYPKAMRADTAFKLLSSAVRGIGGRNAFWTSHNPIVKRLAARLPEFEPISVTQSCLIPAVLLRHLRVLALNLTVESAAVRKRKKNLGGAETGDAFFVRYANRRNTGNKRSDRSP